MNIRSTYLRRIIKYTLQQFYDRRFFKPYRVTQYTEIDGRIAEILGKFKRQTGYFFGASIHTVDHFKQVALSYHCEFDISLSQTG